MGKKLVKFVGYVKDKISRQSNSVKEILFPNTKRQDNPGLTTAVNGIATGVAIAVATSVGNLNHYFNLHVGFHCF